MTTYLQRKIDSISNTSTSMSIDLPRNDVLRGLNLRLSAAIVQGAAPGTGLMFGNLSRLLSKLEILADGKDSIFNMSGAMLRVLNRFDNNTNQSETPLTSPAATGTYVMSLHIPFYLPGGRRPLDCALDARKLSSLRLNVDWATIAALFSTPGTETLTSATLEIEAESYGDVAPDFKAMVVRRSVIPKQITATNPDVQERLPVGLIYRRLLSQAVVADVEDSTVINGIKFSSGSYVFKQITANIQRDVNKRVYMVETVPTGAVMLDFISDGSLAEAINTAGFSSVEVSYDATIGAGTTYIYILKEEVQA